MGFLKDILEKEKENETFCDGLPFYYREISKIIFDVMSGSNHRNIRVLIQDIEDVRESKTKNGLKTLAASTYIVHLNHISSNQLNKNVRVNVCNLLNYFYDITKVGSNSDANATNNTMQESQFSTQSTMNTSRAQNSQSSMNQSQRNQENNFNAANTSQMPGAPMRKLRKLR